MLLKRLPHYDERVCGGRVGQPLKLRCLLCLALLGHKDVFGAHEFEVQADASNVPQIVKDHPGRILGNHRSRCLKLGVILVIHREGSKRMCEAETDRLEGLGGPNAV